MTPISDYVPKAILYYWGSGETPDFYVKAQSVSSGRDLICKGTIDVANPSKTTLTSCIEYKAGVKQGRPDNNAQIAAGLSAQLGKFNISEATRTMSVRGGLTMVTQCDNFLLGVMNQRDDSLSMGIGWNIGQELVPLLAELKFTDQPDYMDIVATAFPKNNDFRKNPNPETIQVAFVDVDSKKTTWINPLMSVLQNVVGKAATNAHFLKIDLQLPSGEAVRGE